MLFHCKHNSRRDVATVIRLATRSLGVVSSVLCDSATKCMSVVPVSVRPILNWAKN